MKTQTLPPMPIRDPDQAILDALLRELCPLTGRLRKAGELPLPGRPKKRNPDIKAS